MQYGSNANTSPMKPMDSKAEKELMEKVSALQREFADIDINHDSYVLKEELYAYMDRRTGIQFDRAIAEELFDHMDKDRNGRVTINEFIKVYIEADEMLQRKIEAAKINKESYKRQQEECLKKAEEERLNEKPTAYGIAQNSMVHITILGTNAFRPAGYGGGRNLYVEATLDDQQRAKTKIVSSGADHVWDEKLTFDVVNPDSLLKFTVINNDPQRGDTSVGEVIVPLSELKDQNIHDDVLDLYDPYGQLAEGKLHVKLQWVHSKAKYFAMIAQKWQANYAKEDEELREYERYLKTLYQPFPGLRAVHTVRNDVKEYRSTPAAASALDQKFYNIMTQAARTITKQDHPNEGLWANLTTVACIAEIIIAILLTYRRPAFFDLLFPTIILLYLHTDVLKEVLSFRLAALGIFVSVIVLDVVWLCIYAGNWTHYDTKDVEVEKKVRTFALILSFLSLIVKVFLALLCYMLNLQYNKQRASVPVIVMKEPNSAGLGSSVVKY